MSKKYRCGKCGSGGLYLDDDYMAGLVYVACKICGNRWPGGAKPVDGTEPIDGTERKEQTGIEEGQDMSIKGPCRNCGRVLCIIADGCCFVCRQAGKGLAGEEKAAALAAVKAKIESGTMRKGGGRRGPRKAAQEVAPAPAGGRIKKNVEERATKEQKSGAIDAGILQDRKPKVEGKMRFAPARNPEGTPVICLGFAEKRDREIYNVVIAMAARLRREPEQQILWMLQNAIEHEAGILAEAGA